MSKTKEAQITPQNSQGISIESLLEKALTNKVPVATIERIMAMRGQLKAEWAKEQFDKAMANSKIIGSPSWKKLGEKLHSR